MTGRKITRSAMLKFGFSVLVSAAVAGGVQPARAGLTMGPSLMKSEGPCAYSVQLQKSVEERRRYLVKLSSVLHEDVAENSAVEDMYGNIKPASYNEEESGGNILLTFLGVRKEVAQGRLDAFSTDCMSCHDGASAVPVEANWRNNPYGDSWHSKGSGSDHPVGMDYESYVAANPNGYKQVFGNNKMVFVDGKVGCLTCHDPLNPERRHLVMSDYRSALCLTCHNK